MEKYLRLTAREAFDHFVMDDLTLSPQTTERLRAKLAELHSLQSDVSVTITMPTHRAKPDYEADDILLKKLVERAENQLYGFMDKRAVWPVVENLGQAVRAFDHVMNLDSLVVYANEHFSTLVKLPVELEQDIVVGKYFDLRPLYRAMQQNRKYYIITVSQNRLRLIQALNDRAVREFEEGDFPFEADSFYRVKWGRPKKDGFGESMEKEFYNDADKSFTKIYNEEPLPVVLAGPVKSLSYFEQEMDDRSMVIAHVDGSFDQTPLPQIIEAVYPAVEACRRITREGYLSRIDAAASAGLLVREISSMIERARYGEADTLFIGEHFTLNPERELYDNTEAQHEADVRKTDQMLLSLLADVARTGGRIVMMEDSALAPYDGVVMAARFAVREEA